MNSLPHIPAQWSEQYQQFHSAPWYGWVMKSYCGAGIDEVLANPLVLFDQNNVIKWYKNKRNRLAEVSWPIVNNNNSKSNSVVLKSYEAGSVFNSLRLMQGELRSIRHWQNVWLLNERGINTPQPVFIALPEKTANAQGVIATTTVTTHTRIREVFSGELLPDSSLSIPGHQISAGAFADLCGKYARAFHDRGFLHRDFSGANILVPQSWDGTSENLLSQFVILDINRIRQVEPRQMDIRLRIQDLERLYMPDSLLKSYYFSYAAGDPDLENQWQKFLKYRNGYRRIRDTRNPLSRGLLKLFTYWPRTG